jgi:hypothetical protein
MIVNKITLQRLVHGNYNSLFGELQIESKSHGTFKFSTVENYEKKIKAGYYNISYTPSRKFNKPTLEITGVKNRYGIRIHAGNIGNDLEGCISIGLYNTIKEIPQQIFYSRMATEQLEAILWNYEHVIHIKDIKDEKKIIRENSNEYTTQTIGSSY